ncbi:excalibur calcium-binding domain-containing protein [Micromonospora sp. WMMA1923]|uniref:excalibur calcium-binding domain-containing protein n=1 Tax=Micromonospora sp. WMMA1923 TaxID=3404125 RepID=UPI003B95AE6E
MIRRPPAKKNPSPLVGLAVLVAIMCCGGATALLGDDDEPPTASQTVQARQGADGLDATPSPTPTTAVPVRPSPTQPAEPSQPPTPTPVSEPTTRRPATKPTTRRPAPFYKNCDAVRAAGEAPLFQGEPGYRPELDRDGDGEACEPGRGNGDRGELDHDDGGVHYANCTAVRAAGKAPIRRGDPGYSRRLDRDGDGIACE